MTFENERDERAWVAFLSAFIAKNGSLGLEAFSLADRAVEELRKRRAKPEGGPYR